MKAKHICISKTYKPTPDHLKIYIMCWHFPQPVRTPKRVSSKLTGLVSDNASKRCLDNGQWGGPTNYLACLCEGGGRHVNTSNCVNITGGPDAEPDNELSVNIHIVGELAKNMTLTHGNNPFPQATASPSWPWSAPSLFTSPSGAFTLGPSLFTP